MLMRKLCPNLVLSHHPHYGQDVIYLYPLLFLRAVDNKD